MKTAHTVAQLKAAADMEMMRSRVGTEGWGFLVLGTLLTLVVLPSYAIRVHESGTNAHVSWLMLAASLLLVLLGVYETKTRSPRALLIGELMLLTWMLLPVPLFSAHIFGHRPSPLPAVTWFYLVADAWGVLHFIRALIDDWRAPENFRQLETQTTPEAQHYLLEVMKQAARKDKAVEPKTVEVRRGMSSSKESGGSWRLFFTEDFVFGFHPGGPPFHIADQAFVQERQRFCFLQIHNRLSFFSKKKIRFEVDGEPVEGRYTISPAMLERLRGLATELPGEVA